MSHVATRLGPVAPWQVGHLVTLSGPVAGLRCHPNGDDDAPLVAADPREPTHLVALYLADDACLAVAATSYDAGRTWRRQPVAADTACTGSSPDAGLGDLGLLVDTSGRPAIPQRPAAAGFRRLTWSVPNPTSAATSRRPGARSTSRPSGSTARG